MGTMDTRRAVRCDYGIRDGCHRRALYHQWHELADSCYGLRMRHHLAAARHAHVSNRSHNGS